MPALNLDTDADRIAERLADPGTLLVACLCAEWCGTCRDYRSAFDQLAEAHPDACGAWGDSETPADRLAERDGETLPTILIEDAHTARFFGTVLPHAAIVERMLSDLSAVPGAPHAPKLRDILNVEA